MRKPGRCQRCLRILKGVQSGVPNNILVVLMTLVIIMVMMLEVVMWVVDIEVDKEVKEVNKCT